MWTQHDRYIGGGPLAGSATGVFGSAVYRFANGSAQPFVMGSAGLLRPQFRIVFIEATGVMGLATGSVAMAYHW